MKQQILEYFDNSFGIGGDEAVELFIVYANNVANNVGKLENEVAAGDLDGIAKSTHSLKGCALNCGHTAMADIAISMMHNAREGKIDAVRAEVAEIRALADAVMAEAGIKK